MGRKGNLAVFESSSISKIGEVTPTKIDMHVCDIDPYLLEFFGPTHLHVSIALNNNFAKNVCYIFLSFYSHENASVFYRVSSYFIVKVLCDVVLTNEDTPFLHIRFPH